MKKNLTLITKTGISVNVEMEAGGTEEIPHVRMTARVGGHVHYRTATFAGRSDHSYESFEKEMLRSATKLAEEAAARAHGVSLIEHFLNTRGEGEKNDTKNSGLSIPIAGGATAGGSSADTGAVKQSPGQGPDRR